MIGRLLIGRLVLLAAVVLGVLVVAPAPARAAGHHCRIQWQTPRSADARWCRHHGWTISRSTVIGPGNRIYRMEHIYVPGTSVIR